jgi:oxalate decarboxylase
MSSYAGEQPDKDARHQPVQFPQDVKDATSPPPSPGVGPGAWADPGASPVVKGETKAGGADGGHPHLFHLADAPANVFPGGGLQGAHEENWPIVKDQNGAVYLARLAPGGVREPHWHPSAWELNFVLQGRARWTLVGPGATQDSFEARKGDLVFAPQGHFHYFENAGDAEDLLVLIVFNSSAKEPDDDIGIVHSLKAMPPDVLAAVFGGTPEMFANLPGKLGRVVIASKTKSG